MTLWERVDVYVEFLGFLAPTWHFFRVEPSFTQHRQVAFNLFRCWHSSGCMRLASDVRNGLFARNIGTFLKRRPDPFVKVEKKDNNYFASFHVY